MLPEFERPLPECPWAIAEREGCPEDRGAEPAQVPGRTEDRVAQDVVSRTDPPSRNAPPAGQDTSRRLTSVEPNATLTACSRWSPGMADPVEASFAGNPQNQRLGSARVAGQPQSSGRAKPAGGGSLPTVSPS